MGSPTVRGKRWWVSPGGNTTGGKVIYLVGIELCHCFWFRFETNQGCKE